MQAALKRSSLAVIRWFDSWNGTSNDSTEPVSEAPAKAKIDWGRVVPFLAMHAACLFVFVVGWSWVAVGTAVGTGIGAAVGSMQRSVVPVGR